MPLRYVITLLLISLCCGCSRSGSQHQTARFDYDKKKMEEAEQKGRDTFPQFLERLKNPKPTDADFFAKVGVSDGTNVEHMWISDVKVVGDGYEGKIGNEPAEVKNIKIGQNYPFKLDDVSDWMYFDKGVCQGAFTSRVLMESETPENAAMMKKQFGWD